MKRINAAVLVFAALLLLQIPFRAFIGEPYPMLVMPSGAGQIEHETGQISTKAWKAVVYFAAGDSAVVRTSTLFPGSPSQYHPYLYRSLNEALASSGPESRRATAWVKDHHAGSSTPERLVEEVCLYHDRETHRLAGRAGADERLRLNSTCRRVPAGPSASESDSEEPATRDGYE